MRLHSQSAGDSLEDSPEGAELKIANLVVILLLLSGSGTVMGPDGKPLPGSPSAHPLMREQTTPVDAQHLFLISVANAIEAQQRRTPGRSAGALEGINPPVSWEQRNDPNSFVYRTQGYVIRVTHYSGGVRSLERLESPAGRQGKQILGSNAIFTADLKNCEEAIWVQFMERSFNFYRSGSANPLRRHLNPEIDGTVPYRHQYQPSPGLTIMNDDAGLTLSGSPSDIAIGAIPLYAAEAGVPPADINRIEVRYKFLTYLICLKPAYSVVGHFEWGYSADIDKVRSSYASRPLPTRWVGYQQ